MTLHPYCAAAPGNRTKAGCFLQGKERNGRPHTGPVERSLFLSNQTINASGKIPLAFPIFSPWPYSLFSGRHNQQRQREERVQRHAGPLAFLSFLRLVGCNPAKKAPLCKGSCRPAPTEGLRCSVTLVPCRDGQAVLPHRSIPSASLPLPSAAAQYDTPGTGVEIERKFVYNKERFHVSGMGGVRSGRNKRYHHR